MGCDFSKKMQLVNRFKEKRICLEMVIPFLMSLKWWGKNYPFPIKQAFKKSYFDISKKSTNQYMNQCCVRN